MLYTQQRARRAPSWLGATPNAAEPIRAQDAARDFQNSAQRAASAVAFNQLFRAALPADVRGAIEQAAGPAASPAASRLLDAVRGLQSGVYVVQPYKLGSSSDVRVGVVRAQGVQLGWWPIALQVLRIAGQAALAAGGFVLVDGWEESQKIQAEAALTKAKTDAAITTAATSLQQSDPRAAGNLLALVAKARTDAESGSSGMNWLETAGAAATGIGTGVLLAAIAAFLWSRRKSSGGRKRNPSSSVPMLALAATALSAAPAPASSSMSVFEAAGAEGKRQGLNEALPILIGIALLASSRRRRRNPRRRRARR